MTRFQNELGNTISMSVEVDEEGVHIFISGPDSEIENTLTRLEAEELMDLLFRNLVL